MESKIEQTSTNGAHSTTKFRINRYTLILVLDSASPPHWGVSSVPFSFRFPFQLHCELVSSGIISQSVKNILN